MKRKVLCLLSVMILILSLAACGSSGDSGDSGQSKSDFDAFMEIQKNMKDIKDVEFKMNMDAVAGGDEDMTVKMSGTAKEVMNSPTDIDMEMKYSMAMPGLGSDLEGTMYVKDQAVYMDMMGQKMKVDASNEMSSMMNVDTNQLLSITEDMVSNLTVTTEGSDTIYSFDLDAQKAMDYFQKNAGASQQMAGLNESDITFEKMKVAITADENQMAKTIDMDCKMTTKVQDESMDMSYKIAVEYISINSGLKIDFPDFSDYQELTV